MRFVRFRLLFFLTHTHTHEHKARARSLIFTHYCMRIICGECLWNIRKYYFIFLWYNYFNAKWYTLSLSPAHISYDKHVIFGK